MEIEKYIKTFSNISKKNLVVGLTGNIGSGKTEALKFFKSLGAITISADEKVSMLLTNKKNCDKILIRYPKVINCDGLINRKKLAQLIFTDKSAKKVVESIIHPLVMREIISDISKIERAVIVIEVPLLYEEGIGRLMDINVLILASEKNRIERLLERGMDKRDIILRMKSQLDDNFKIDISDIVIFNNGSKKDLYDSIKSLYQVFRKMIPQS